MLSQLEDEIIRFLFYSKDQQRPASWVSIRSRNQSGACRGGSFTTSLISANKTAFIFFWSDLHWWSTSLAHRYGLSSQIFRSWLPQKDQSASNEKGLINLAHFLNLCYKWALYLSRKKCVNDGSKSWWSAAAQCMRVKMSTHTYANEREARLRSGLIGASVHGVLACALPDPHQARASCACARCISMSRLSQ